MAVTDSEYFRIVLFTPGAHTVAYTHDQRTLLGLCYQTRKRAVEFLDILTLYRRSLLTGEITTYQIPFDFENTCLCIDGWDRLSISSEAIANARGMKFAREITRLAFVFTEGDLTRIRLSRDNLRDPEFNRLHELALLFHNTRHVSGITDSSLRISRLLQDEPFLSLFSFQPFIQKAIVQGFALTKSRATRYRLLDDALVSVFEGWDGRIRSALIQARLLNLLNEIHGLQRRCDPDRNALRAIGVDYDMVRPLIQQAISNGQPV